MKIQHRNSFLEMAVSIEEDKSLPSHGDAYVTLRVGSSGFSGSNDLWVSAEALRQFCQALLSLERTLKGEATLESISPNELKLRVFSASALGHLGLEGRTGYRIQGEHGSYWHEVAFGFEFELLQLTAAAAEPWVMAHAA